MMKPEFKSEMYIRIIDGHAYATDPDLYEFRKLEGSGATLTGVKSKTYNHPGLIMSVNPSGEIFLESLDYGKRIENVRLGDGVWYLYVSDTDAFFKDMRDVISKRKADAQKIPKNLPLIFIFFLLILVVLVGIAFSMGMKIGKNKESKLAAFKN